MNIFKRIKNLWRLSELEEVSDEKWSNYKTNLKTWREQPKKMAQIIKRKTMEQEIKELLADE